MTEELESLERVIKKLDAKLSVEEKFKKMLSMCQTVREIILSQMPSELSGLEKRKR